jgi:flagellin-like protein
MYSDLEGGTKKGMKILRSKKALSPVVASIILIAVTVAVSIAVAAWMGALTFSFMGTKQLTLQKIRWGTTGLGAAGTFTIYVNNTGTKDATISQITVNYVSTGVGAIAPVLPFTIKASGIVRYQTFVVTYAWTNGTTYDISVITSDNYKFTNAFKGGANAG